MKLEEEHFWEAVNGKDIKFYLIYRCSLGLTTKDARSRHIKSSWLKCKNSSVLKVTGKKKIVGFPP